MQMEKGSLSIESENMFPIIKKWLYSDHDILFVSWCPTAVMRSRS